MYHTYYNFLLFRLRAAAFKDFFERNPDSLLRMVQASTKLQYKHHPQCLLLQIIMLRLQRVTFMSLSKFFGLYNEILNQVLWIWQTAAALKYSQLYHEFNDTHYCTVLMFKMPYKISIIVLTIMWLFNKSSLLSPCVVLEELTQIEFWKLTMWFTCIYLCCDQSVTWKLFIPETAKEEAAKRVQIAA